MGYIVLAKGKRNIFFWSEVAWAVVSVGLSWVCVTRWGVTGAGIAFFGSYVFHALFIYVVVRQLSGFRWSRENQATGLLVLSSTIIVFCGGYVLPLFYATGLGVLAVLLTAAYSFRVLTKLMPWDEIPLPMRRLLVGIGAAQ
jgi:PST family polysaccharide transporter